MRALPRWVDIALLPLLNVVLAFLVGGLIVLAVGQNPLQAVGIMLYGAFGYGSGFGYTLYYTTDFIFAGLAVSLAFHAGLFNIGPEGQAFKTCMRILDLNRPTIGACSVGLAQGAINQAVAYARDRRQFGRTISEFQGIQFMLADMQMQTEAARAMLYDCTRMADRQEWDGFSAKASMVKCFACDTAMKVTTDAVQIFGGAGYMRDYPVERFMRDAKINQIFEGTNQIQRLVIARHMLRQ